MRKDACDTVAPSPFHTGVVYDCCMYLNRALFLSMYACLSANDGFSRQEAISIIMEKFDLGRAAATRQLTRYIMPVLMSNGATSPGEEDGTDHGKREEFCSRQPGTILNVETQPQHLEENRLITQDQGATAMLPPQQPRRSVVISNITSGIGRALLKHYSTHGHAVAGCGRTYHEIQLLQLEFPEAKLNVVDVADDEAVAQWAATLAERGGMHITIVAAHAGMCPEAEGAAPAWEVPREDLDTSGKYCPDCERIEHRDDACFCWSCGSRMLSKK